MSSCCQLILTIPAASFPPKRILCCVLCRSQRPRALRFRFAAARLLRFWVRIPPVASMCVCCECCVLSGRGLCDGLITRPEESYRLCSVVVCDQETWRMRRTWPSLDRNATEKNVTLNDIRGRIGVKCYFTSYWRLHKKTVFHKQFCRVRPHCLYCFILASMHSVMCGQLAACGWSWRVGGFRALVFMDAWSKNVSQINLGSVGW
jgi:hypothetical protein